MQTTRKIVYVLGISVVLALASCTGFIAEVEKKADWQVLESGKIVLHYRAQGYSSEPSPTPAQAQTILENQNFYYYAIQDSIRRNFGDKVLIYLYNRDEALDEIGTNGGGHSIPKLNTFYYTFLPENYQFTDPYQIENPLVGAHELVHVISHRTLGYPATKLMSEGYAVWIDGTYARQSIQDIVRSFRQNEPSKILTPDQLLFESTGNEGIYYPNCGILLGFWVKKYGVESINALFTTPQEDFKTQFEQTTGDSWESMSADYALLLENM